MTLIRLAAVYVVILGAAVLILVLFLADFTASVVLAEDVLPLVRIG